MTPLNLWLIYLTFSICHRNAYGHNRTDHAPSRGESFRAFSKTFSNIHHSSQVFWGKYMKKLRGLKTLSRYEHRSSYILSALWVHSGYASICNNHWKFHRRGAYYDGIRPRNSSRTSRNLRTYLLSFWRIREKILSFHRGSCPSFGYLQHL